MTYPFDPNADAIFVEAVLLGPLGNSTLALVLDTGATCSMISEARLRFVGCDPSQPSGQVQATFGGGVQLLPVVSTVGLTALGVNKANYSVVCHTLPPSAGVDGVLGLDFFPGCVLTIDFVNNTLSLT
jgi:hypothetical protein